MVQCNVTIPGVGQCEVNEGDHDSDGCGCLVHVRGAIRWNGHERLTGNEDNDD